MLRAALVLLALTSVARADDDVAVGVAQPVLAPPGLAPVLAPAQPHAEATEPADFTPSYRGQVLGADAAAVGLVVLAAMNGAGDGRRSNTTSLLELGATAYLIGAPLIHLVHDRGKAALWSLGLRIALPVLAGFVADRQAGSCSDYCADNTVEVAIGILIGVVSASALDALIFADADPKPRRTHLTMTPSAQRDGMTVGLAGSF